MNARQIMTREVITVTQDTSVETAARLLLEHRINAVPVLDDDRRFVGMVNLNDLFPKLKEMRFSGQRLARLFDSLVSISDLPAFYWNTRQSPVAMVMNRHVPCLKPEDNLEEIANQLLYGDYHSLPVIEQGRLVGLISRSDLIRLALIAYRESDTHE